MRLLLALLFFLQITLSVAIDIPPLSDVGSAGDGAADPGIAGKGTSGGDDTGTGEGGNKSGDDPSGGDTGTGQGGTSIPGEPASSGNTDTSDENAHKAEELIDDINDILDGIQSIVSLAIPTSDSSTYTITSRAPLPTAAHPCLSAQSIYSACGQILNFTDLSVSQQASCLCYRQFGGNGTATASRTTTWVPDLFDGFVSQCDKFVATQTVVSVSASVTGAVASAATTGICASVGDVRASPTTTMTNPTATAASIAPPTSGVGGRRSGLIMGLEYSGMLFVMGVTLAWSGI